MGRLIDGDALVAKMNLAIVMLKRTMKNFDIEDDPECQIELKAYQDIRDGIKEEPTIEPEPQWIPFKTRPLTEEEQDEHPEWNCILDCKLPDDGQRILVSINLRGHEEVQQDEFYSDDGSYLDSGYEIGTEAVAWMPLPEPWRGEEK